MKKRKMIRGIFSTIRNNSLSIILFVLFLLCSFAESIAGWKLQSETLIEHGLAKVGYWHNLCSNTYINGLASNWQAAFLQLAALILFSGYFFQRGAPHSRNPQKIKSKHFEKGKRFSWLYRNSLSVAFLLLFIVSLVIYIISGHHAYNEECLMNKQSPISISSFLLSAKFWSSILQTWQAEFLAIALFVVLSIFLRQQNSPESKPLGTSNKTTGEVNK